MAVPLTPLKAFKCSYDDCFHSFDTEREMKAHLKDKKIHPYYCGKDPGYERIQRGFVKCDFHGKTLDELIAHKVETMLPWIVGERMSEKPKKLNHIVCEFCGEDFESLAGREDHRKKMHQADQHVVCKGYLIVRDQDGNDHREGCGSIFDRASQLISHIEGGFCAYIKPMALRQDREHKRMVKLILDDPEGFKRNMRGISDATIQPTPREVDDMSGGVGIDLLSQLASSEISGQPPMSPQLSAIAGHLEVEWPEPLSSDISQLSQSMTNVTLSSIIKSEPPFEYTASDNEDVVSQSSNGVTVCSDEEDKTTPTTPVKAWSTPNVPQKLFGHSKAKAIANWDAINAAHQRHKEEDEDNNIFVSHFWDPTHIDFKPEFFYCPDVTNDEAPPYRCPFESCKRRFFTPQKIGDHMRESHAAQRNLCPVCLKDFQKLSSLVAHFEASSQGAKCDIARRSGYSAVLFEMTGGLIQAYKTMEEPISGYKLQPGRGPSRRAQRSDVEDNQWRTTGNGVKDYDYRANSPTRIPIWKS
ncbi:hypothetical protein E4T49_03429 [Aureobasidium sp. EXF-10728]|nr:hypothetical protein E4T49_03429 [Aureobasidium sp. EXF-10728]